MISNPWLSFRQYEEKDAQRFKGRDADIKNLFHLVEGSDICVLYAESGIGKSSLVKAGLVPNLRGNMYLPIPFVLAEEQLSIGNPRAAFENNIRAQILSEISVLNKELPNNAKYNITDDYPDNHSEAFDNSLWWFLRSNRITSLGFEVIPVIVFDQFEEIFKLPVEYTDAFFDLLHELSLSHIPEPLIDEMGKNGMTLESIPAQSYKILFSLREEYIGQLDYWGIQRYNVPALKNNRYSLQPLTNEQAREIVTQQGVDTLDLIADKIIEQSKEKGKEHISTLILSVLCSKLYEMAEEDEAGNKLPYSEDELPPSTTAIIGQYYNEIFQELHISKKIRKAIESALVSMEGKRLRVPLTDPQLKKIYFKEDYLDALDKRHLIKTTEINEVEYVELVHDKVAEVVALGNKKVNAFRSRKRALKVAFGAALAIIFVSVFLHVRGIFHASSSSMVSINNEKEKHPTVTGYNWTYFELDDTYETVEVNGKKKPSRYVFYNCPNLQKVVIKNCDGTEKRIPYFIKCENLREIVLPEGVEDVDLNNIIDCPQLKRLNIPASVTKLYQAFKSGNNSKLELSVSSDNSYYQDIDGVIWEKNGSHIVHCDKALSVEEESLILSTGEIVKRYVSYTPFPDDVTEKEVAFDRIVFKNSKLEENRYKFSYSGKALEKVRYVPDSILNFNVPPLNSVTKVLGLAAKGRKDLKAVLFSKSIKQIGSSSFAGCSNLELVRFCDGVVIDNWAFEDCKSIDTLLLRGVGSISPDSFVGCSGIKYLELPDSIRIKSSFKPSPGKILHCDISFSNDSLYREQEGVIFNTIDNIPIAATTDYHTYVNGQFCSIGGALVKKDELSNENCEYEIVDIPAGTNVKQLSDFLGSTIASHYGNPSFFDNRYVYFNYDSFSGLPVYEYNSKSSALFLDYSYGSNNAGLFNYLSEDGFAFLKELHVLTDNPSQRCLDLVPKQYRSKITVFAPKPFLGSVLAKDIVMDYKAIEIEPLYKFIFYRYKLYFVHSLPFISEFGYVFYPLFVLLLVFIAVVLLFKARKSPQAARDLFFGLLLFAVSLLAWFTVYWLVYGWLNITIPESPAEEIVFANLVAVPLALAVFMTGMSQLLSWRDLIRGIRKLFKSDLPEFWNKEFKPNCRRFWSWMKKQLHNPIVWVIILLLIIGSIVYNSTKNKAIVRIQQLSYAKELLESGNKEEAARTLFDLIPEDGRVNKRDTVKLQARLLFQQVLNSLEQENYPYHFLIFYSDCRKDGYYIAYNNNCNYILDAKSLKPLLTSSRYIKSIDGQRFILSSVERDGWLEVYDRDSVLLASFQSGFLPNRIEFNPVNGILLNPLSSYRIEVRDSLFSVIDTLISNYPTSSFSFSKSGKYLEREVDEHVVEIRDSEMNVIDTLMNTSYYDVSFYCSDNYFFVNRSSQSVVYDEKADSVAVLTRKGLRYSSNGRFYINKNKYADYDYEVRAADLSVQDTLRGYDYVSFGPREESLVCYKKPDLVEIRDASLRVIKTLHSDSKPYLSQNKDYLIISTDIDNDGKKKRVNVYDSQYHMIKTLFSKGDAFVSDNGAFFVVERDGYDILDSRLRRIGTLKLYSSSCALFDNYLYDSREDVLLLLSPTKEQWQKIIDCYKQHLSK